MGNQRVGPYELLGPLGAGGFGTVHRARHVQLGVERAVKVVRTSPDARARFGREVRALARVRHPNVVTIHEASDPEAGEDAPVAWLAMDLVQGRTLEAALAGGRFAPDRALDVCAQVARGLDALHEVGIVHRDVKPANVLLTPEGRAVLVDLGLALTPAADERLTQSSAVLGTPLYLAPELLVGGEPTPATDVHALGLLLHELVTGTPAYLGADGDPGVMLARILAPTRPRPSQVDPSLPRALDDLVARATALDPAARPPRAGAFADLVDALRAGRGLAGRRAAAWPLAALAALAATLLAAGLVRALSGEARRGSATSASTGLPAPAGPPADGSDEAPGPGAPTPTDALLARADRQARAGRRPLLRLQHPKGTGPVRARFVDAGRVLTVGERDGRVRLWTLGAADLPAEGQVPPGATALAAAGGRVVVSTPGELVTLSLPALTVERAAAAPPLRGLTRAQDGALLALFGADGGAGEGATQPGWLDALTLERRPAAAPLAPGGKPAATVCASSRWLLVGVGSGELDETPELLTFDQPGGRLFRTVALEARLTCAAPHPSDPDRFALGFASGALVLHRAGAAAPDVRLVAPVAALARPGMNDEAHATSVRGVAFTPDGRRLVSVASGNPDPTRTELRWWDDAAGAPLGELGQPPGVLEVHTSPDGRLVVCSQRESWAELWAAPP